MLDIAAQSAYESSKFDECVKLYKQALAVEERATARAAYNAARCAGRADKADDAFALLERAGELGFHDVEEMLASDDLARLRNDARWKPVVQAALENAEAYHATINPDLKKLFDEDQKDAGHPSPGTPARIYERSIKVREIVAAGRARVADDRFHAATVLSRGDTIEDIRATRELALKALELDPRHEGARYLAAQARDRELMFEKKPQMYGTQTVKNAAGVWELYTVDPLVTDEERDKWNVLPLVELKWKAAELNGIKRPK
jgi:hypothetical protein